MAEGEQRVSGRNIESKHQQAVMTWAWHTRIPPAEDVLPGAKVGDYLFAIPNGGSREIITAAILKAEGVKTGVHDLFLPLQRNGKGGLWIEMKAPSGPGHRAGTPTQPQLEWLGKMQIAGYEARICYGRDEALDAIVAYLGLPPVQKTPTMQHQITR
jgi:hypothetical protein